MACFDSRMKARLQVGFAFLAALVLAGCVVVVRQPAADPFAMRVTKDGTEILLRQNYAKVKVAMETMVPPKLKRYRHEPEASAKPHLRVKESLAGEECRGQLEELMLSSAVWHTTVIEVRRVADGLTQVRAKSEHGRVNLIFPGSTTTRTPDIERQRLTELIQAAAQ